MAASKEKAPALARALRRVQEAINNQLDSVIISPSPPISQAQELALYEAQMAEADATGDLDAWVDRYLQWLDLWPLAHLGGVE